MAGLSKRAFSLAGATALVVGLAGLALLAKSPLINMPRWDEPAPVVSVRPEPPPPVEPEREPTPTARAPTPIETAPPVAAPTAPLEPWVGPAYTPTVEPAVEAGPPVIERPHWRARPADLGRYYPRRAAAAGREGVVELECMVRITGRLDCSVAAESPPGWGFGQAAQAIARDHRMEPATRDGAAIEARYRMRVPFNLD